MDNLVISLVPSVGMMLVAAAAVFYWRRVSGIRFRWFWIGAALWAVSVALKFGCSMLIDTAVIGFLKENLPYPIFVLTGGCYIGVQSSVFEMGLTLLAVLIWRQLGTDAGKAIGIGVGAGALEAFMLGILSLVAVCSALAGMDASGETRKGIEALAAKTPLFWLVAPVERIIAILCHAASRALILLGVVHRRYLMIVWGFLLFTLLDGVAGGVHVSLKLGEISMWWVELAFVPFALISVPILRGCYATWGKREGDK